jgi:predicted nucleic acid-binding protein
MGVDDLTRLLSTLRLIALDTMVFVYHLADHPRYSALTTAVLDAVESGRLNAVTTTVTLTEILTAPAKAGDQQALQDYEIFLTRFPNLHIAPLDVEMAREAALVRGEAGLRTPDAIQVAAARLAGAEAILTNDRRWVGRFDRPAVVLLDDYAG